MKPSKLTFGQAIIVDYKGSSHGCACSRDYDAAKAAVAAGKIEKKGTKPYEIPGTSGRRYIVANGEHKAKLDVIADGIENASNPLKKFAGFVKFRLAVRKMVKSGVETVRFAKLV